MDFLLSGYSVPETDYIITTIPGDKSVSHRAVIFGSLADGTSTFRNFLDSEDCLNTLSIFQALGVEARYTPEGKQLTVIGKGLAGLTAPNRTLDVGNSGTGIRLITGVLCGLPFSTTINGDASIQKRPMKRIILPLTEMGAQVEGQLSPKGDGEIFPPLHVTGQTSLTGIHYRLPVASAQVKSAILMASLFSQTTTTVEEPEATRNHTEIFLSAFGADYSKEGIYHHCSGKHVLHPPAQELVIPSDISSAAFFMVLGCLLSPKTSVTLTNIGINPTRDGILTALRHMGAELTIQEKDNAGFEPIADITCRFSSLQNIDLDPELVPNLIDELPILAVCALFGTGTFRVRQAKELRHKESDRIATTGQMIRGLGGSFVEYDDGFDVIGGPLKEGIVDIESHGDHRIAMASIIGSLLAGKRGTVSSCDCINTSFPNFFQILDTFLK